MCVLIFYKTFEFHENLSSGSWVVPCGREGRQEGMMKLTVVFRNFVNAPKNRKKCVMIDGKTIGQERNAKESEKKSDFLQFSNPKNCPIF